MKNADIAIVYGIPKIHMIAPLFATMKYATNVLILITLSKYFIHKSVIIAEILGFLLIVKIVNFVFDAPI